MTSEAERARVPRVMRGWLALVGVVLGFSELGCAGPGPYGYAQVYTPLDAEDAAADGSVPFDPSAIRRKSKQWNGRLVTAFATVEQVKVSKDNPDDLDVVASLRTLQARNLCTEPDEASCRVTVSEQSFGLLRVVFSKAIVVPKAEEHPDQIQPGSLLRVIGKVTPPPRDSDDLPRIDATLVREWPYQAYVTTAERSIMRR